jgi:hypothetical protein
LPLRMVQANATADAEQPYPPIRASLGSRNRPGARAAQWRISHHWHAMPLAPGQQVTLYAAITETVRKLTGRAAIAFRNTE